MSDDTLTLNRYGCALVDLHRYGDALKAFDQSLKIDSYDINTMYNRSSVLRAMGRHPEALTQAEQASQRARGSNITILILRGLCQLDLYQIPDAVATFEAVVRKQPDNIIALTWLAHAYLAAGNLHQALQNATKAASSPRADAEAFTILAMCQDNQRSSAIAFKTVQRAIQLSPMHWRAHNANGLILAELGKLDEAIGSFEMASKLITAADVRGFGTLDATINRGQLQFQRGSYDDAARTFEEVRLSHINQQ
jgi:tetratricopeptide (TPR) repeat protein